MPTYTHAFSGFAVADIDAARAFYRDALQLTVDDDEMGLLVITLPGGATVIVYPKPDHTPATYTVLNLEVADIDAALDELQAEGIETLRYDGFGQDERGVSRGRAAGDGPDIAWFADPSGNIVSVLQSD